MRVLLPVVILLALSFAGCSGKKGGTDDEDLHVDCPDGTTIHGDEFPNATSEDELEAECPDDGGDDGDDGDNGNSTPNAPPTLVLKTLDAPGGNETNVTMIGGAFTFTAEGSSDSDGAIAGIAVTVDDGNRTRTLSLYAGGQFIPQTVVFDRPGIVNVTAAMVDDRAAFAIFETNVYVNEIIEGDSRAFPVGNQAQHDATLCVGPNNSVPNGAAVDNTFTEVQTLIIEDNASFVEVYVTEIGEAGANGAIDFAICTPEGTPISVEGNSNTNGAAAPLISNNAERLPGSSNYYLFLLSKVPQSQVHFTATIHYEPRPAEPAA